MKPRLLDLYCGAGGAAEGYSRAGFEVVGVDIKPQPNYPFPFVEDDAIDLMAEVAPTFDAIHASPPCQAYSVLRHAAEHKGKDAPDLIGITRELLQATGLPYIIENVTGAADYLRNPIQLCGTSFGKGLIRHRLFETNFPAMGLPCAHGQMPDRFDVYEHGHWYRSPFAKVYGTGGGKAGEHWAEVMDIDWMTRDEMKEAIPPYFTEHVGGFLMTEIIQSRAKAAA